MKTPHIILFVFALYGCAPRMPNSADKDDNSSIVEFVEEQEGNKVGDGICFTLVRKAMEKKDKHWYKKIWCNKRELKKHLILSPISGDAIEFKGVVMKNGDKYSFHIGIVYKVINDSLLIISHQNVCDVKDRKQIMSYGRKRSVCNESVVEFSTFNLNQKIKGKIIFYHF